MAEPTFDTDASEAFAKLQPAFVSVFESLKTPVTQPSHLQHALGLGDKLSWRIFRAATTSDIRAATSYLPGRKAVERFLSAAKRHGVPPEVVSRAGDSFKRFEEMVARHANDRHEFETMVSGMGRAPGESEQPTSAASDARHLRTIVRSTSLLLGKYIRVQSSAMIISPSADGDAVDMVMVRGTIGLRQMRQDVPLIIQHQETASSDGDPSHPQLIREPLESNFRDNPYGLMTEFCSKPMPEFRVVARNHPEFTYECRAGLVGAKHEYTYYTGHIYRACAPRPSTSPDEQTGIIKGIVHPTGVFHGSLIVHEDLWDDRLPTVQLMYWPLTKKVGQISDPEVLPFSETARYLGRGLEGLRTPTIPRYSEIMTRAMDRAGWDAKRFRTFTCQVVNPLPYSQVRMYLGSPV